MPRNRMPRPWKRLHHPISGSSSDGDGSRWEELVWCGWEELVAPIWLDNMGVSKNRGTPNWMVYNGKPY